ncbi:U32 family peptidase [Zhengella mangrovi]|uniref:Ubiquinone biosynthesis protein UbiV n=1 Tax=Zhengella mangrovi TaxID=1982044 RepID=A0A2G1QP23_9HYPH|nr:U32 family peptidase [Zhengella mangrovi]PHP67210.1 U32 family peptidase [Zhengella mangrovi]
MSVELTIGPIAYHWPTARKRDFYARIADEAPVATVYLGEVICSKRSPFFDADLPGVIERLQRGGKRVVLSTLAEVVLPRERHATLQLCSQDDFEVEINNVSGLAARGNRPHRIGPFLNATNEATISWMAGQGASHVCLPHELPAPSLAVAAGAARELGITTELQVFGRAPLAVSARCYHARAHGRHKDNCQFVCEDDTDGMPLVTVAGEAFLRVNGIQTQSESYVCLAAELADIVSMGVSALRLMPQDVDMVGVAQVFPALLDGGLDVDAATGRLEGLCSGIRFSNGFFHKVPGRHYVPVHAGDRVLQ